MDMNGSGSGGVGMNSVGAGGVELNGGRTGGMDTNGGDSGADSMKHVVFITVDSLRDDYVFGSRAPDSLSTLPRLANQGLRCTNAFSNAAYTKASFLSILSGTYPWMFDSVQGGFGPERPHIATILSEAGYATAGFHTNTYLSPTYRYDRGFDHYMGRDSEGNSTEKAETAYNKLVERAVATEGLSDGIHWAYKTAGKHLGIQLGSRLYKPAEELNDAVVEWTRGTSGPQFVWVHYMDVHNPYYPHEGTVSEGISRRKAVKLFHRVNEVGGDAADSDIATLERLYCGEIEYFDRQLGSLLARLDETLGLDETLVVFTSDHGEAFNEKGLVYHPGYAMYDENIHIPLLLSGPDIPTGVVETPVSNVDLVPTILSQIGVEAPDSMVGEDITSFVEHSPDERLVFAEAFRREDGYAMVTDGNHKLVRDIASGDDQLYDRHDTPPESRDLLDTLPDVAADLQSALDRHIRSVARTEGQRADVEVTEDVRLQLRKLGYDE